jgi:hypothetical protein
MQVKIRQVVKSAPAIPCIRTPGEIVHRIGQNHAAGPAFKCLQLRKAADPGRNARELHGLAAIRAAGGVCGRVHDLFLVIESMCWVCGQFERQLLFDAITLKSFEIGNDVGSLSGIEPEFRHAHVAGTNAFDERLL